MSSKNDANNDYVNKMAFLKSQINHNRDESVPLNVLSNTSSKDDEEAIKLSQSMFCPSELKGRITELKLLMELKDYMKIPMISIFKSITILDNRIGWNSSFCVAAIEKSKKYLTPVSYQFDGEPYTDSWSCRVVVKNQNNEDIFGTWVSIKMAKDEGWYSYPGSKWPTMPEHMLKFRAVAFFSRMHCPELLLGFLHSDELYDLSQKNNVSIETEIEAIKNVQTIETTVENKVQEKPTLKDVKNLIQKIEKLNPKDLLLKQAEDAGFEVISIKEHEKTKKTWIQVKEVGFMEVDYSFVKEFTKFKDTYVKDITSIIKGV